MQPWPNQPHGVPDAPPQPGPPTPGEPRSETHEVPAQLDPLPRAIPHKKRKISRLHLLVVEDDARTASAMKRLLEVEGYAVRVVGTYREALQTAMRWLPDLLICDIGLPGKDGLEVMKTMRRAHPHLQGLVVSGHTEPRDMARSREAGFAQHLSKPVNVELLKTAIQRILE